MLAKTPRSSSVFNNSLARMSSFSASSRTVIPSVTVTARGSRLTGGACSICAARPGLRLHEDARDEVCALLRRIVFQSAGARARREACARTKVYLARPWECRHLVVALLLGLVPGDCCQGVVETATVVRPAWERRDGFVRSTTGTTLTWCSRTKSLRGPALSSAGRTSRTCRISLNG